MRIRVPDAVLPCFVCTPCSARRRHAQLHRHASLHDLLHFLCRYTLAAVSVAVKLLEKRAERTLDFTARVGGVTPAVLAQLELHLPLLLDFRLHLTTSQLQAAFDAACAG